MGLHNLLKIFYILVERFIIIESVLAEGSKYEVCKPRSCSISGLDNKLPFLCLRCWTRVEYCGHPGFGIDCEDGKPIYKTSSGRFLIQSTSYENQTIRLVNLEVISNACFAPL